MTLSFSHFAHVALVFGLATRTTAYWVLGCGKPVAVERLDPIVSPGTLSNHIHSIMGGDAFDWDLDYNKTQTSNCTTCGVSKDLSNYWVPKVYFHAENGSYVSVEQVGGVNVYYQQRIDHTEVEAGKTVQPFPPGFRMLAGDSNRRTYNNTSLVDRAIEYVCLPANGMDGTASSGGFPNHTCLGGLQIRVRFPSCWDGENLDSSDHRSHVAYPSTMDNGYCDSSHPVRIMALLYEVTWEVDHFDHLRKPGDQPFVLSSGDKTGYSWHGDFLNGWDTDLLRQAISEEACGDKSQGDINLCNTFKPYLLNAAQQNKCPTIPSKIGEQVDGVLSALPGLSSTMVVNVPAPTANAATQRLRRGWLA